MQTYREGVKRFVADFGTVRIRDLDRSVSIKWAETQPDWVVNATRIMLTDMCQTDHLILSNPLENLQRIYSRGRKDWPVLGDIEVVGLIESALTLFEPKVGNSIAGIIATSAYMGLRKSEAVALSLDCVDPVSRRVLVDLQVGRKRAETGPKSGTRLISLTPKALEAWERLSPVLGPTSMFPMPDGRYWEVSNFYVRWSKVATSSGIPGLQFHELRHYCATWLKHQGVDEWAIAVQLGHAMPGNRTTQGYIKARNIALQHIDRILESHPVVLEPEGRAEFRPQRLHRIDPADSRGRQYLDQAIGRNERRKLFMNEAKNNRDGANFRENENGKGSGDQR